MKAIELLKELTVIISTSRLFYENKANFEFTKAYEERIYKAIAELESLQSVTDNIIFVWDANNKNIDNIIVNDVFISLMVDVNKNYALLLKEIK